MDYEIFETKTRALADNDAAAEQTRALMRERGAKLVNLMGSPGAGKTSVLLRLIDGLKPLRVGVMEADVDSDVDARTVAQTGARVIQLHTAGLCHMDADMTRRGLERMGVEGLDVVFLENIGNLVCPAEFEVGADLRVAILSVPEGDDKPLKYPLMFRTVDCLIVNKLDTLPIFDFDLDALRGHMARLRPEAPVFPVSARTGEGVAALADWLRNRLGGDKA
ncbi:MAG: hydrogenase nickel incorporation protein HypB [Clostridia bacterium]|nr:hydrogenase nickel incorporation protein HypB [Clostridia bacterium]